MNQDEMVDGAQMKHKRTGINDEVQRGGTGSEIKMFPSSSS